MRTFTVSALLLLVSCSMTRGLDPGRLPSADELVLEREISYDFNEDGIDDKVEILDPLPNSEFHRLKITLSGEKGLENTKLVYAFSNPGASLELLHNGSFKVIIDHSGAGRSASLREYTISYRKKRFILSGVTVSEYDRIDPELGGSCDINLLTGFGERNNHSIKIHGKRIGLSKVDFNWLPKECRF